MGSQAADLSPLEDGPSLLRAVEAIDAVQEHGLSSSVRTDDGADLPALHLEADALERPDAAKRHVKSVHAEKGILHCGSAPCALSASLRRCVFIPGALSPHPLPAPGALRSSRPWWGAARIGPAPQRPCRRRPSHGGPRRPYR